MKRNHLVIVIIVAALVLIAWSGFFNHLHHAKQQANLGTGAVLVPDNGGSPIAVHSTGETLQNPAEALENKPAPAFTLADLDGKKVSLSDYKGKAVLVNFWATWCGPCKVEIPWFEDLHTQYASQGFEILGVSNDSLDEDDKAALLKDKQEIRDFATRMRMNYPVLTGGDKIADSYGGVDSLPTSFFIDRKGVIVAETNGLHPRDEIEADIKKALGAGGQ